ncbi:MAG: TetR/AcrR family transcriptional regulator [Gulosibacter sp.]|uniref:TetR/AcrR family transcriptional regulator n=1 Tax=Gulosibacter sp. TaxID=2817531 RepID=UPI003F912404
MTISEGVDEPQVNSVARANGERGNVRGQATRIRILEAAERLFAERGISALPLRDISKAAEQKNHAAVQYHFGNRAEVVKAILEYRGAESETKRANLVADFMMGGKTPTVSDLMNAFIKPLTVYLEPENYYLPFLSRLITEEGGYEGLTGVHTGGQVMMLRTLLYKLLPEIPDQVLDERWWVALTGSVHTLARYQVMGAKRIPLTAPISDLVDDLVIFQSAGLAAAPHSPKN